MSISKVSSLLNDGYTKRHLWAWSMYDFANSGYTTVVITAIFNAYFVSVIAENVVWATFLWTSVLSISYLIVMIVGPILGAYIDVIGSRKKVLVQSFHHSSVMLMHRLTQGSSDLLAMINSLASGWDRSR